MIDPTSEVHERQVSSEHDTGDSFVALEVHGGAANASSAPAAHASSPFYDALPVQNAERNLKPLDSLNFVPYYFRANRGGKGHMRVGLRPWHRQ